MVRTNNLVLGRADGGIVLLKDSVKALSIKSDCNSRYVYLNPHRGGMIAVARQRVMLCAPVLGPLRSPTALISEIPMILKCIDSSRKL